MAKFEIDQEDFLNEKIDSEEERKIDSEEERKESKGFTLYRQYDSNDKLLFIGTLTSPSYRIQFPEDKPGERYLKYIVKTTYEFFDNEQDLKQARIRAIAIEKPLYNKNFKRSLGEKIL